MPTEEDIVPGAGNILVVENEVGMRATLCAILEDAGYKVSGLDKGAEALEMIRNQPFNVVITDIRLPDVNGMEILELAKEIDPEATVIMMTGYTEEDLVRRAVSEGAYTCIYKPFDMEKVIRLVENISREKKK